MLGVLEMCPHSWGLSEHGCFVLFTSVFPLAFVVSHCSGGGQSKDDTREQQLRGETFSLASAEEG